MSEGVYFNFNNDFSEAPPPPERPDKTPEFFDDDDDEDIEDEPKTIRDYIEKEDKAKKEETEPEPEVDEAEEAADQETEEDDEETEAEADGEEDPGEDQETEPDSPEMNDEEIQEAAVEIIDDREQAASSEAEEATSPEDESEALAAEAFLETAKSEIEQGQPVDEALEAAKKKTLEELDIEVPEEEPDTEEPATGGEGPPEPPETTEAAEPADAEEEPDATVPPVVTPPPPTPPTPPIGGGGSGGPGGRGPAGPGVTGGNVLPSLPAANVAPRAPETRFDRRGKGRYLLVGGIVGYMIGRRGGRLRTEAKLLPVQRKLEKEVAELHDKIFWHEASVRSLAHEHAVKNPEAAERATERLKAGKRTETKPESVTEQKADLRSETVVEQKTDVVQSEKIGKMIVEAQEPAQAESSKTPEQLKPIDLMTVPELLAVAERIEIEQSNIRRLYESNRLDYEGLRRIVRAYLRGERYDKLVRDYLLTPEKYAYAETLSPNGIDAAKMPAAAPQEGSMPGQNGFTPPNAQNPANPQTPNWQSYTPDEQLAGKHIPQMGAVVAGVIIAILVLIFIFAR